MGSRPPQRWMPFTPFHLGPAVLFGLLLFRYLHLLTFSIAGLIVDLEPFLVLSLDLDYPLHGFFHSFIGGSIAAIGLSLVMLRFEARTSRMMSVLKLEQKCSPKHVWLASFSGTYLHILLDSMLYTDIRPFYPLQINPFYISSTFAGFGVYAFCALCLLGGVILYIFRFARRGGRAGRIEGGMARS